jgi:hypothetical protein
MEEIRKTKQKRRKNDYCNDESENKRSRVCNDGDFYTLMIIGESGAGKSEVGDALSRDSKTFIVCDYTNNWNEKETDGVIRCVIDTQKIDDTKEVDKEDVEQIVNFMKGWKKGVNAVGLIINGQEPGLDAGTQKLIETINNLFNNAEFWDHFCLIITKCYKENTTINEETFNTKYRKKVEEIIVECIGPGAKIPELPMFFVDSNKLDDGNDISTKNNLSALHAFVVGLEPLRTEDVVFVPSTIAYKIEIETREKQKVNEEIILCDENKRCKKIYYEDQKREKRIGFDKVTINYSEWETTKEYTEEEYETKEIETQKRVLIKEEKREVFKFVDKKEKKKNIGGYRCGCCFFYSYLGEHDYYLIERVFQDKKRVKTSHFDGSVSYSDWEPIIYTEKTKE